MQLAGIIDGEIARLEGVKASLDPWKIEQDRLEASDRCLFDLQPAMAQVRKYEAATERRCTRPWKEFAQLEAELKATQIRIEAESVPRNWLPMKPDSAAEEELAETVAQSAPRTPPPLTQIPETIQFPAKAEPRQGPELLRIPSKRALLR